MNRKETGLRRITALLIALTLLVVVYDVWCLTTGHAREGLYILPFGLAGFVAITVILIRRLERPTDR